MSLNSVPIVFTEVIVQWAQQVKLNVIVWKDSLENDASVSQTVFSKPFLFVVPNWNINYEILHKKGDFSLKKRNETLHPKKSKQNNKNNNIAPFVIIYDSEK